MTKDEAKALFGSVTELAKAMGVTRQSFYKWADPLPQSKADQVLGAYMRTAEERDRKAVHYFGWLK